MTTTAAPSNGAWRMARATAPLAKAFAGHRLFPLWAVMHHKGRKSGLDLSLPIALLHTDDTFVVTLPWGPRTNWVRNVLVAGECTLTWKGSDHHATQPQVIGRAEARTYFGSGQWWVIEHVLKADSFLRLARDPAAVTTA